MPPSRPFVTSRSGALDTEQLLDEAIPLGKLVAVVGLVALIPLLVQALLVEVLGLAVGSSSVLQILFPLITQFLLAVGAGLILMYVIARGLQIEPE
jgi:hypothetical protein